MKEFLLHSINAIRRALSVMKWLLTNDKQIRRGLFGAFIQLQCLWREKEALERHQQDQLMAIRKEKEALERHQQDQLMAIRKEKEALERLVQTVVETVDGSVQPLGANSGKNGVPIDFDTLATAANFPNEIVDMLKTEPIKIVDIGALELEGQSDLYAALYARCSCEIIGFDPQSGEPRTVRGERSVKTILPIAVGDGHVARFYRVEYRGASSTLRPNEAYLDQFHALPTMLTVREERMIRTHRLDDIKEIDGCDLLKIDVQGGELSVLNGGRNLLQEIPIILTEVEFAAVYEDQPLFADIDTFLRAQGFFLQDLKNPGHSAFKAGVFGDLKSRLMWMDAVYVKEPAMMEKLDPERILKAALIAHVLLRNPGLAASVLEVLDRKIGTRFLNVYQLQLKTLRNSFTDYDPSQVR